MTALWANFSGFFQRHPHGAMAGLGLLAVMTTGWALARAARSRWTPRSVDPAPIYGRAFFLYASLALIVTLLAAATDFAVRHLGVAAGFLRSFWDWPAFPWHDVRALSQAPADVDALNLVIGGVTLVLGPVVLGVTRHQAGEEPPSAASLRHWGHHRGAAEPWLKTIVGGLVVVLAVLAACLAPFQPMSSTAGSVVVPAQVLASVYMGAVLLFGLLIARGNTPEAATEQPVHTPTPPEPPLTRRAWEAELGGTWRFELRRSAQPGGALALKGAPTPEGEDCANQPPDPGVRGLADTPFRLLHAGDEGAWKHQVDFVEAVAVELTAAQTRKPRAVLLHAARGGGRSSAVFEAAVQAWLQQGRRTLVLHPSDASLLDARSSLEDSLRSAGLTGAVPMGTLEDAGDGRVPAVLLDTADRAILRLLPAHDSPRHQCFFEELGLVVLENIEELSGIRATNLAVAMRRLLRVCSAHKANPVVAQTLCVNPAERSGAQEYARWLTGGLDLTEAAIRDTARRKGVHRYHLASSPPLRDTQEAEPLPAAMRLAWASAAFGGPMHVTLGEDVTESDMHKPGWVDAATESAGRAAVPDDPWVSLQAAWIHVCEARINGILSLTEQVVHGGIGLDGCPDHLVVAVPALQSRGPVSWLLDAWARSAPPADGQPVADLWRDDLRPLGTRLICGHPGVEMLEKHLLAAMAELPGPEGALCQVLPEDWPAQEALARLRESGRLAQVHRRRLGPGGDPHETVELALTGRLDVETPLDTVTGAWVRLVVSERRHESLMRVDREHVYRVLYPGCLVHIGEHRYQVPLQGYLEFIERHQTTGDEDPWLACQITDTLGFTEPERRRTIAPTTGSTASVLETHEPPGGVSFQMWRAALTLSEEHIGYRLCVDDGAGGLTASWHESRALGLRWETRVSALVIALPNSPALDQAARATLRRMLLSSVLATTRLERNAVDVDVVERLGSMGQVEGHRDLPAILLIDPFDGGAGLLDALGASPYRVVVSMLRFVWLWASDLAGREANTWEMIGHGPAQEGDRDLSPNLAPVLDLLTALLGEEAGHSPPTLTAGWIPEGLGGES